MFGRKPRARTARPLGLYVTNYWLPELKKMHYIFYEHACQYAMNMQVRDVRQLMERYYADRRKAFLKDITTLQGPRRDHRRLQLLGVRKFRNHYRKQWADFATNNPGFTSRY